MDIAFEPLIKLQEIDAEIHTASLYLESLPRLIKDIEDKISAGSRAVAESRENLARNQKNRRDLETQVKDIKVQIGKYKRQLNEVKSNRDYQALLKEIEESQKKVDEIEETIISEMLGADDIEDAIRDAQMRHTKDEETLASDIQVLRSKQAEMEARKKQLEQERSTLLPQIPADQMELYASIFKKRAGKALSSVKGDFCSLCHMRIRPQMLNEIRDRAALIFCENCGRILYWPDKPE